MRKLYEIKATCYDRKGKLLSVGWNNYKRSHPLAKHFAVLAGESNEKVYLHAELSACLKARTKKIHTVFVERRHNNGTMANAEPCKSCKVMLRAFGVQQVKYTHENGWKTLDLS